jgi:two-component system response regulator YesN
MFSVLIVDDEEPVLDSYEFMLNSFSESEGIKSPFILTGKARTGYDALKLIHETKPDLIFMDINIPTIDGLAVLEDVYKKYPRMVIILSTAYERFDIAQRAIPLGIFAYLVKPVSKNTFFSTLEKALVKLRSLPPENSEFNDSRLSFFRRDICTAMDKQLWLWYREKLALPSDHGLVFMVELNQDMETLGIQIAEQLSYKHHCTFDVVLNRGIFLVCEEINPEVFREKTLKILEKLLGNVMCYSGFGRCYRGSELYLSYNEALNKLMEERQGTDTWRNMSKKIAMLRQKIGLSDPKEIKALFAEIWKPLFSENFITAKLRMVSLFTLLLDDLYHCWSVTKAQPRNIPSVFIPLDPAEIMDLTDLYSWQHWAEFNFDKLMLHANLERQGNYPVPLVKALLFIKENFSLPIQLSSAAEAAQVNTTYLSRLFSEHLKTNFIDHITALRINEAERLLKEKSISVKEAAFASGFQDPNYFSKIFKKIKGILPSEITQE